MTTELTYKKSSPIRSWWASIRPFSLGTSLLPVFFGTALANRVGFPINSGVLFLTLFVAILIHAATNLTNSLYDWISGHDQPASPQAIPILRDNPHGEMLIQRALYILALLTASISVLFAYYTR